jgi:hypothetical protein
MAGVVLLGAVLVVLMDLLRARASRGTEVPRPPPKA